MFSLAVADATDLLAASIPRPPFHCVTLHRSVFLACFHISSPLCSLRISTPGICSVSPAIWSFPLPLSYLHLTAARILSLYLLSPSTFYTITMRAFFSRLYHRQMPPQHGPDSFPTKQLFVLGTSSHLPVLRNIRLTLSNSTMSNLRTYRVHVNISLCLPNDRILPTHRQ